MATPVAGPWTKYAAAQQSPDGPWNKYATATSANPPQQSAPASPMETLSKATGLSAGPNSLMRALNQIKAGLTGAQEGGGLPQQPTALGNLAEGLGVVGTQLASLGTPELGGSAANAITEALPGAKAERAGQAFQEIKGAIGDHTVAMTDKLAGALGDIKDAVDTGSTLPSVINKFVSRVADTEQGPLTYNEARQFYSNVSQLSASEKMAAKPADLRLINQFRVALGDTIKDTVDSAGKLEQFQKAMKDFSSAKNLSDFGQKLIDALKKAAIPAAVGGGAYAAYKDLTK
jgi:hypothetical protein